MIRRSIILSVEDNPTDVMLIKWVLEKKLPNYDLTFIPDMDVAIEFLDAKYEDNHLPILILLDIKLIKGNGLDLLQVIKEDPRFEHIPVVMLSSSGRQDDKETAINRGCNEYVEKLRNFVASTTKLPEIVEFWTQTTK